MAAAARRGLIDRPAGRAGGCPSIDHAAANMCVPDSFEFSSRIYRMPAAAGAAGVKRFAAHWARPRANLHGPRARAAAAQAASAALYYYYLCPYVSVRGCDSLATRPREGRKWVRWSRNWFREIDVGKHISKEEDDPACHVISIDSFSPAVSAVLDEGNKVSLGPSI